MKIFQTPKKSLGQNFLIDKNIINKIVKVGNIDSDKVVMEIGPGYGNLTEVIHKMKPKKIFAIEKDKKLFFFLKDKFKNQKNVSIINADILNIIRRKNLKKNIIIFGNLPYNISTQILASLIMVEKWPPWYEMLIFMFQEEVADRIMSNIRTKELNRLCVLANWRLEIKKHFNITKNCFFPRPKVNSTLLSFKPKKNIQFYIKNPKNLEKITRVLFSNKRKMINKNFEKLFGKNSFVAKNLNIDLKKRPENLSIEMYYKIAREYEKLFG